MKNIAHRARTLNQWFENQQSKKFKDFLLSGKVMTDHNPGTRCLRIDIWQCVQIPTPNQRVAQLLAVSKIQTTQADATSRLHNNPALTCHADDKIYKQRNEIKVNSYAKQPL